MEPTFQNKIWRNAAYFAFIGMNIGALIVVGTMPFTFHAMGENSDMNTLALHCISMKSIQYWLIGIGGFAFIAEVLAVLASMGRSKTFRMIVMAIISLVIILALTLVIWGSVESDKRKEYFQSTWNDMDGDTKHFIETYFYCCGFENETEYTSTLFPVNESCYAIPSENITWSVGCYQRVTSSYLGSVSVINGAGTTQSIGDEKVNPFLVAFIFSILVIILALGTNFGVFVVGMTRSTMSQNSDSFVLENRMVTNYDRQASNAPESINESERNNNEEIEVNDFQNGNSVTNGTLHKNGDLNGKINTQKTEKASVSSDGSTMIESKPWYKVVPDAISKTFGNTFYWIGFRVASHPKMTILFSLIMIATMSVGMLQRYESPAGSASAFLADDNPRLQEFNLYAQTFVIRERDQRIIIEDESNVISAENYLTTLNLDKSVKNLTSSTGQMFSDICQNIDGDCRERSVFEFWSFNNTVLDGLSNAELLTKINENPLTSPVFGDNVDITHILGGIGRDSSGNIVSAKAHLLDYVTIVNGGDWEELFIDLATQSYTGLNVYPSAFTSRRLESGSTYTKELPLLFAGFALIFVYIIAMSGKFSLLEHKAYVALMGVTASGLSMAGGIGISSAFGLKWTQLHLIVPFLVIGIGVDDMFVIIHSWDTIEDDKDNKEKSIPEKAGLTLRTAGVSITITSVTDLVAFAVGASSELGGFASFSVFVAICIILLFFLECTFFLACVCLDQRRKDKRYDACLACCYKHKDTYKPGKCSEREFFQTFFEDGLGRIVTKLPFQVFGILATLALTGVMAWGFYNLKVRYDPDWYLPVDSYLITYNNKYDEYFNVGAEGAAYVINADFYAEREKLHTLYERIRVNSNINTAYLQSWFEAFVSWAATTKGISDVYASNAFSDSTAFYTAVNEFLYSSGRKYIYDVVFKDGVIIGSRIHYTHVLVSDDAENIEIVESLQADCEAVGFSSGQCFPYGGFYLLYEITRIIKVEVYRNLGITLACVFIMVLPMLASLQMGFWVSLCVVFTTVDVAGSMYFAGLAIEASTIITLLLSIGLAVDYAAHVGHKFLTTKGSRKMRARVALGRIGLAVFNGGFSTFLALVMLAGSDTYSYKVFFTVFACVIGYGLWNGLVFLPCVLALMGPPPNSIATEARLTSRHYAQKSKVNDKARSANTIEQGDTQIG
uniref:patched domain-containing protein 3-like n=1 Tax=Styela clava TaxID=7725 RepID=UPI00193A8402|nr:patched domain-containing protein 3-like [Styela clava]